jgi:hypothetical protein
VRDANLFVAILADDTLLVISLVEYKAKMGTEMKDWAESSLFNRKLRTVFVSATEHGSSAGYKISKVNFA